MTTETTKPIEEPHVHGPDCHHEHGEEGHVHDEHCQHGEEEHDGEPKPEKINQIVDIRDIGPCRKHIKVTIERPDIDKKFDEKYKELVGESVVPGFRPGKAPRKIVVRKFKKEVDQEVKAQ